MEEFTDYKKQFELIGKIPYLKNLQFEDRKTLGHHSFLRSYSPNEKIIEQNEINLTLYFLIRGSVDIFIDNKRITSIRGGGKIFGEMSFVNHTSASADVVASSEVVMMCMKIPDLLSLNTNDYLRLQRDLYQSIAEILAQKLLKTNELAQLYLNQGLTNDLD